MSGFSAVQYAALDAFESAVVSGQQHDPAPGNFQASRLATLADDSLTSIVSLTLDKVSLFFTLTPDSDFERRRVWEKFRHGVTSKNLRSAG
jgi:hypothetical protein